ncbi:hypothetical protein NEUTE1DRAFT_49755, partial [Neurospora tetrasperma FGSC 2508]
HWVAHDQEDPQLPEFLFHIQHADSQATYSDSEISIKAADTAFGLSSVSDASELLGHAIRRQDWTNRRPSRFISTFEDAEQARQWGYLRNGPVYMYIINPRLLPRSAGKCVFWLSNSPYEYLILDQIPRDAIVASEKIRPRTCIKLITSSFVPGLASQLITNHVNWACRVPSCLISTFGSFDHAYNWGMQRHRPVTIHQIDTNQMHPQEPIFRACHFTPNCFDSEYLFLHDIAGYSITRRYSLPGSTPSNGR